VPDEVVNEARRYLTDAYQGRRESRAEARRLAEVTIHEILKNGTAYDSFERFLADGKLGAKDLSVLIERQDISPEIRALLGEHHDPLLNFARTAGKMSRLIWNERFLARVRDIGLGSFLCEGTDRPPEATAQLAAEGSESFAPLNGLWTFPDVAQAFNDALGKEKMGDLYRSIIRLNGLVKYSKTVLSPTTAMRNFQSAMFFSLANGHFDLTHARKGLAAFREQVLKQSRSEDLAYMRRLKKLGVVYDSAYAGEMRLMLEDARLDELLAGHGDAAKMLGKANDIARGFYTFGDDFWKIIGFENERIALRDAGFDAQAAEAEAARRIRATYPTYSMVGRGVKWLSRFPLVGTFVSFPAEIIRTSANMLRLVHEDLHSTNPQMRKLGAKRLAGIVMVSGAFYALAALSRAMLGVDDDEDEAVRELAPPWQRNSMLLYTGRDEDGHLHYFDLSFLDPYGYLKRPLTALTRGQPWQKAAAQSLKEVLEPFLGSDISAEAVYRVVANRKVSGAPIYNEGAQPSAPRIGPPHDRTGKPTRAWRALCTRLASPASTRPRSFACSASATSPRRTCAS